MVGCDSAVELDGQIFVGCVFKLRSGSSVSLAGFVGLMLVFDVGRKGWGGGRRGHIHRCAVCRPVDATNMKG